MLIIREVQIKTTMKYHLTLFRIAIIKNLQIINTRKDVEKREHSYTAGGKVCWCSHYGKLYGGSWKIIKNKEFQKFSGGPVIKTPCFRYRGNGLDSWLENWDPTRCTVKQKRKKKLKTLKIELICDPAIPLPVIYLKRIKNFNLKGCMTYSVHSSNFYNNQDMETAQVPINRWLGEILLSQET